MLKKIEGYELTKMTKFKSKVKVRSYQNAKTRCMVDHIKPTIREEDVDHIIIHIGTNELPNKDKTPIQICNDIINLSSSIKDQNIKVTISEIIPRNDNIEYHDKALLVNEYLDNICKNIGFDLIKHNNIKKENHLNAGNLHLNQKGRNILKYNFRRYLLSEN